MHKSIWLLGTALTLSGCGLNGVLVSEKENAWVNVNNILYYCRANPDGKQQLPSCYRPKYYEPAVKTEIQ